MQRDSGFYLIADQDPPLARLIFLVCYIPKKHQNFLDTGLSYCPMYTLCNAARQRFLLDCRPRLTSRCCLQAGFIKDSSVLKEGGSITCTHNIRNIYNRCITRVFRWTGNTYWMKGAKERRPLKSVITGIARWGATWLGRQKIARFQLPPGGNSITTCPPLREAIPKKIMFLWTFSLPHLAHPWAKYRSNSSMLVLSGGHFWGGKFCLFVLFPYKKNLLWY